MPFGHVADVQSGERRNRLVAAYDRMAEASEPRLWISTALAASSLPLTLQSLERHPYSAQTFVPIGGGPYLVVVCKSAPDGQPDLGTLKAFIAQPTQAVTYGRNVWHHGLTVWQAPAQFVACMSFTATGGDDVFLPLTQPVQVVADEGGSHV